MALSTKGDGKPYEPAGTLAVWSHLLSPPPPLFFNFFFTVITCAIWKGWIGYILLQFTLRCGSDTFYTLHLKKKIFFKGGGGGGGGGRKKRKKKQVWLQKESAVQKTLSRQTLIETLNVCVTLYTPWN